MSGAGPPEKSWMNAIYSYSFEQNSRFTLWSNEAGRWTDCSTTKLVPSRMSWMLLLFFSSTPALFPPIEFSFLGVFSLWSLSFKIVTLSRYCHWNCLIMNLSISHVLVQNILFPCLCSFVYVLCFCLGFCVWCLVFLFLRCCAQLLFLCPLFFKLNFVL